MHFPKAEKRQRLALGPSYRHARNVGIGCITNRLASWQQDLRLFEAHLQFCFYQL